MAVKIRLGANRAYIQDYHWFSPNKAMESALNSMLDPNGPSGSDPYPDKTAADAVVAQLGATIEYISPLPKEEPGLIH